MLLPYDSPETKGIPEEYLDKDRTYAGTKIISTGVIYNTTKVKETSGLLRRPGEKRV